MPGPNSEAYRAPASTREATARSRSRSGGNCGTLCALSVEWTASSAAANWLTVIPVGKISKVSVFSPYNKTGLLWLAVTDRLSDMA